MPPAESSHARLIARRATAAERGSALHRACSAQCSQMGDVAGTRFTRRSCLRIQSRQDPAWQADVDPLDGVVQQRRVNADVGKNPAGVP
ncbi:hypothetical protein G6F22_015752 [Rhizopus arrhizus]|nr:hypothetical protein G6F22_015752 [Rhizopus arrhizus]